MGGDKRALRIRMRVHASASRPSDQESAGDQEFPIAPVGGLSPGFILEEIEKQAMSPMSEHIYRINFLR
jgi:hypothetical protein